ncbi:MAG: hypothetical protein WDM81_14585 [Rhizomicrobium sp.]
MLLIDSGLLTLDEIDCLRPRLYEELTCPGGFEDDEDDDRIAGQPVSFVKAHDAYTLTSLGEPLLAGAGGAGAPFSSCAIRATWRRRSPITAPRRSMSPSTS